MVVLHYGSGVLAKETTSGNNSPLPFVVRSTLERIFLID
jgi:hypothetical protein